jgi:hypothetical protein
LDEYGKLEDEIEQAATDEVWANTRGWRRSSVFAILG